MTGVGNRAIVLGFAVASLAGAAKPAAVKLDPRYLEILHRYARGERTEAIAALGEWSDRLQKQVSIVEDARIAAERCPKCPNPLAGVPLRAAVMLHSDRDDVERPKPLGREETPRCPGPQAWIAGRYAAVLARDPATRDFARRFFLATALLWQHRACFDDALNRARAGLELFPRDAELLLTAGCVLEERAVLTIVSDRSDMPSAMPQEWFKEARRDLADAVAIDPDLVLARIRLGRVLWRLGQPEPAREALEAAVARARERDHRYLAHLFLGRVHEDARRLDQALSEYRLAAEAYPEGQTAAVALSFALQLTGDVEGSRGALAQGLPDGWRSLDAYGEYLAGNTLGADRMDAALHREALE